MQEDTEEETEGGMKSSTVQSNTSDMRKYWRRRSGPNVCACRGLHLALIGALQCSIKKMECAPTRLQQRIFTVCAG